MHLFKVNEKWSLCHQVYNDEESWASRVIDTRIEHNKKLHIDSEILCTMCDKFMKANRIWLFDRAKSDTNIKRIRLQKAINQPKLAVLATKRLRELGVTLPASVRVEDVKFCETPGYLSNPYKMYAIKDVLGINQDRES